MTGEPDSSAECRAVSERYALAWTADDLAGLLDCYREDFTLHYLGRNRFSGDHVGKRAAIETLLAAGAKAPRRLLAVDEILAGPGAAALVVREELIVDGEPTEIRRVLRYRVAGGQMTECWLYDEDQALIDRAWA